MSAEYVRRSYNVPAKRGQRVTVAGRAGVIVSFPGQYIGVRFDGEKRTSRCHPTWKVDYDPKPHDSERAEDTVELTAEQITEIEALPCQMYTQDPFPFAWCETHDETFPIGSVCRYHNPKPNDSGEASRG